MPPRVAILKEVEDTKEELASFRDLVEFVSENPRAIKRLVNVHRLVRILLVRPETPLHAMKQRKLVAWLVFCSRWDDLVDDVIRIARAQSPQGGDCLAALAAEQPVHAAALHAFGKALGPEATISPADLQLNRLLPNAAYITQMVRDEAPT
jgi:hypothetical protein